jgi:hypothetical protein
MKTSEKVGKEMKKSTKRCGKKKVGSENKCAFCSLELAKAANQRF